MAAEAAGVSARTASKWLARWRAEGKGGLVDRSSAPKHVANKTDGRTVELIAALRRLRFSGPEIAELIDRPSSTVLAVLSRIGMGKLGRPGLEPAQRYERERPGELVHIDVKKLGRIRDGAGKRITGVRRNGIRRRHDAAGVDRCITGWDYVHVAVDGQREPHGFYGRFANHRPSEVRTRARCQAIWDPSGKADAQDGFVGHDEGAAGNRRRWSA